MLSEEFKLQHNETILPLQYCKLVREGKGSAEEWIGHLRVMANEGQYKERTRWQKEQFNNRINGNGVMTEIIK